MSLPRLPTSDERRRRASFRDWRSISRDGCFCFRCLNPAVDRLEHSLRAYDAARFDPGRQSGRRLSLFSRYSICECVRVDVAVFLGPSGRMPPSRRPRSVDPIGTDLKLANNHTSRKSFDFQTSAEIVSAWHFKCESTFPPSQWYRAGELTARHVRHLHRVRLVRTPHSRLVPGLARLAAGGSGWGGRVAAPSRLRNRHRRDRGVAFLAWPAVPLEVAASCPSDRISPSRCNLGLFLRQRRRKIMAAGAKSVRLLRGTTISR